MRPLGLMLALAAAIVPAPSLPAAAPVAAASGFRSGDPADPWWKHAVFYEIYPRSFQDSDGDGIGDLDGIISRLDYLQWLGIDAIWLTPIYPSPQVDFGYDISDYEAIDPRFGTLGDFDRLIREAGKRHIRIIMDLVLNHTSDRSPWFEASRRSRTGDKADWYIWSDGIPASSPKAGAFQRRFEHDGRVPPNNWESVFGGSAWTWVPERRQFYYHRYYRQQPDLNWRNPAVRSAMRDVMRFWLDRGVAGFRLDAVSALFEDADLRDEPELGGRNAQGDPVLAHSRTVGQPGLFEVMRTLRAEVDRYPGAPVLIGETYLEHTADLRPWYGGAQGNGLQLPMDTLPGFGTGDKLDADAFRRYLDEAEHGLEGATPLFVFDNHDKPRSIDRFGDGIHDIRIAKLIATLLLTTRAAALTYYGAPIGMRTTTPARRADVRDPRGITGWPKDKGRDGERTPMQWTPGRQAGFSTAAETWLPVAENHRTINVQSERSDAESLLNWYRRLIQLRRTVPALRSGSWRAVDTANRAVLAYLREAPGHPAILVALNMSAADQSVSYARVSERLGPGEIRTLASNVRQLRDVRSVGSLKLPAYCALVLEIGGKQAEAPTDAARTRIPISAPIVRRPRGRS